MSHTQIQLARGDNTSTPTYIGPNGEVTVNTQKGSLVVQDGTTAGGKFEVPMQPAGSGFAYSAPATGATITTVALEKRRIIDPAGTIAALTVTLPPTPNDGDTWEGMTSQQITALTVNAPGGATVNGGTFGTAGANSGWSWVYRTTGTKWFRRY